MPTLLIVDDEPNIRDSLRGALDALTEEYLAFARFPRPQFEEDSVNDMVSALIDFVRPLASRQGITLRAETDPSVPPMAIDRSLLRQAVLNLIKNGLEASGQGGHVTVAAAADADALDIVVADTGPGLDDEQRANLFVPGYSTKGRERGIGLTVVERIVNDHGGAIAVDSAPGRGSTFRVRLPRSQPRAAGDERS